MAEPPSLTILAFSAAAVVTINVAGLVSTVGAVAAATGSAKPINVEATMTRTIAIPNILPIALLLLMGRLLLLNMLRHSKIGH
jgi:hypothetical protein